jgi:hypothetical protein
MIIRSYMEAKEALQEKKCKRIMYETWLVKLDEGIGVELYKTTIVRYLQNGDIILNAGDYYTPLTKRRMNDFTPTNIQIYQKDYLWYVDIDGKKYPFENYMKINKHGMA